jgi:hypothetical protein
MRSAASSSPTSPAWDRLCQALGSLVLADVACLGHRQVNFAHPALEQCPNLRRADARPFAQQHLVPLHRIAHIMANDPRF